MAVGNLTLNGRTFVYSQDQSGLITWLEVGGGVPSAFGEVTSQLRWNKDASNGGRVLYRNDWRIKLPVVAAEDTACICEGGILRNFAARIEVTWDSQSTTVERTAGSDVIDDLAGSSIFLNQIINGVRPV